jgi:hypothetical protein
MSSASAESNLVTGDVTMKKKMTRGFWSWLMGHGWDSAGSNG